MSVPDEFTSALATLRPVPAHHPLMRVEEVPAPRNIAPFAAALRAVSVEETDGFALGTGRFVILYDPDEQPGWHSRMRLITHVRAQMDPEMGEDPLLGEVVWSWVHDALDAAGANVRAMNGTVTRELSQTFGGLQLRQSEGDIELRASWSPVTFDLAAHMDAWLTIIETCCGTVMDE